MHNPNPFDFVPFGESPLLFAPAALDGLGDTLSGYLEVRVKALTPIHIVGALRAKNTNESKMYRQDGEPCIPASTIRGCLRAFVETLTNGWVSQATPEYEKKQGIKSPRQEGRHIGFRTFDPYEKTYSYRGRTITHMTKSALNPLYDPNYPSQGKIDIASYLFGLVAESHPSNKPEDILPPRKGKVSIEDAHFHESNVNAKRYWLPDLDDKAFMGGGKPSRSNWWYFQPTEVRSRHVRLDDGRNRDIVEFVGGQYWGRKFYYHQDPVKCTQYYDGNEGNWFYENRKFQKVQLECIEATSSSNFRIYVDRLPKQLLQLLVLILMPGTNIRHKLGYGKAYGYGSVEFEIVGAKLRGVEQLTRIPGDLSDHYSEILTWVAVGWQEEQLKKLQINQLIDSTALTYLAQICGWIGNEQLCFTYPPFRSVDPSNKPFQFQNAIHFNQFRRLVESQMAVTDQMTVNSVQARQIAQALFEEIKKPIHFRYYQERAAGWEMIARRRP